jgi:hypothetical protein
MANSLLNGNKVLSYPKGLAANETDGRGAPVQYMLFKINDSVRSQKLKGDTMGQVLKLNLEVKVLLQKMLILL